jgi:hypothetical protein
VTDVIQVAEVIVVQTVKIMIVEPHVVVYAKEETAQGIVIAHVLILVVVIVKDPVKEAVQILVVVLYHKEKYKLWQHVVDAKEIV